MIPSTEPTPYTSSSTAAADHECDFCGQAVPQGAAVERVQRKGDEYELVTLCRDCAFDD